MVSSLDSAGCAFVSGIAAAVYAVLFPLIWAASERRHPRFQDEATEVAGGVPLPPFTEGERADFSSRVISTVHCIIILPIIVTEALRNPWRWDFEPANPDANLVPLQVALCISVGYFLADLVVIVFFRLPLWGVFALHHIFALIPIGTNLFQDDCRFGTTIIIGLFLLVEVTTIPLNIQTFAEQAGYSPTSALYTWAFYLTFLLWIPSRIVVPVAMDVIMVRRVAMQHPFREISCFVPGMISAVLISLFCLAVFCGLLVPALLGRWRGAPSPGSDRGLGVPMIDRDSAEGFTAQEEMLTHVP